MRQDLWLVRPMVVAVSSCFGVAPLWANPTGPQVMHGTAQIQGLGTSQLKVINSPSAIIHWQGFSIGAGQVTQFVQQSASSAVLNRVVGADISRIHGQLLSNGRVFLINPAGILIGAGGVVDTAGFVGSTLNMLNADFLAGKLKFQGDGSSGSIVNQGWIRTGFGGNIVLVAPNIENSGLIDAPGGQLVLAAGRKMTIGSLDLEGVQFEIQAPGDSVLNVGKLLANGGAVGVFAGTLRHSGDIRANALVRDEGGRVVLKGQGDVTLAAGSTISANGKSGGDILVQSGTGQTRVAGQVSAEGSAGRGGDIKVLGERVSIDNALLDASGTGAGGQIRIGGDYQGANPRIANASRTFIGPNALLRADSRESGDGGRIIVWADKSTQYYGALSARGGAAGGNGGFAEVSGKESLIFAGTADVGAPNGLAGNLLLDPLDLYVDNRGGLNPLIIDETTDVPGNAVTISPATLQGLDANVTLFAGRYMRIGSNVTLNAGRSFRATVAPFTPPLHAPNVNEGTPPNRLDLAANITTNGAAVTLSAPAIRSFETAPAVPAVPAAPPLPAVPAIPAVAAQIATNGGAVVVTTTGPIDGSTAAGRMAINAGSGAVSVSNTANIIQIGTVSAGSFTAQSTAGLTTGALTTTGAIDLISTNGAINVQGAINSGGGKVTATTPSSITIGAINTDSIDTAGGAVELKSTGTFGNSITTRSILTGNGAVTLEGSSVTTTPDASVIETTGPVSLTAKSGNINVRVNNSSGVTASAKSTNNNVTVNIDSTATLNVTSATAETTACFFFNCASATVTLASSGGNVNVGTVTAIAPVFGAGGLSESVFENVNIRTTGVGNSIFALPAGSQVKAVDVALGTEALSGGSIGTAAAPVNVSVKRLFTFDPNGAFRVVLNGPNQLVSSIGRMPTGGSYNNSLVTGGGLNLDVSATGTTVTINDLTVTAAAGSFTSRVHNQAPRIDVRSPNSPLVVTKADVPAGGAANALLPVTLQSTDTAATGNLTVTQFTRQGTGNPSTLTLGSTNGMVTLGTVNAANDAVTVTAPLDIIFSPGGSLTTGGRVDMTSTTGNLAIGLIDTSSGGATSSVNLTTSCAAADTCTATAGGNVFAVANGSGLEVNAAGDVTIDAQALGDPAHGNPFDLAAGTDRQVTFTTPAASGRIGNGLAGSVVARASKLEISAPSFDVNTSGTALQSLEVPFQPIGTNRVTSTSTPYIFQQNVGNLDLSVPAASNAEFANGTFKVTLPSGNINVLTHIDLGATGSLELLAPLGSISAATRDLSARSVTLTAGSQSFAASAITFNSIGIGGFRPDSVNITAGNFGSVGRVLTGAGILGEKVNIKTFGQPDGGTNSIQVGSNSNAPIGGAAAGQIATEVTLEATGPIQVGSIFSTSGITTDGVTTKGITVSGGSRVTVDGTLNAHSISVEGTSVSTTGAITGDAATGGSVVLKSTAGSVAVGGAISVPGTKSTIELTGVGGAVTLPAGAGGVITAGDGSTITVTTPAAFSFATLNAGAAFIAAGVPDVPSSVTVKATGNITQDAAGTGITGRTIELNSGFGAGNIQGPGGFLQLHGVTSLTVASDGTVGLDANGSTLGAFSLTRGTGFDTATFDLGNLATGQVIDFGAAASPVVQVLSPASNPLDFTFNRTNSDTTTLHADGIVTRGGSVNITASGPIDASSRTIDTTGTSTDGRGHVTLSSTGGSVTTGTITTSATALKPADLSSPLDARAIDIVTNCNSCNVVVSGNLSTGGAAGGPVSLRALFQGSVTRPGAASLMTPHAILLADGTGTNGFVTANLVGTSTLNLTGGNGFNVSSDTAFNTVSVATRGTGTGTTAANTLNLTAPGQTYTFNRLATDLFTAAPLTNTFEVVAVTGTPAPTSATFRAVDGDLLVKGRADGTAPIAATNLTLDALSGALKLQGNNAAPLTLTNTGTQSFTASGNVEVGRRATIAGGTQTISSTGGNVTFSGGTAAGEAVTVLATGRQRIFTAAFTGGNVTLQGGSAAGTSVTASFDGVANTNLVPDTDPAVSPQERVAEQQIEAGGSIQVFGGSGGTSSAVVTGNQRQLIRANGDIRLTGGDGTNAKAQIVNTGTANQQVGESRFFNFFVPEPYQTNNVILQGGGAVPGTGAGSSAEISAMGPQQILTQAGAVSVLGGSGADAFAQIVALGTGDQSLGGQSRVGPVRVEAGTGAVGAGNVGAFARIGASNAKQTILGSTLQVSATTNNATLSAGRQNINVFGALTLDANSANALIEATSTVPQPFEFNQTLSANTIALNGGGVTGSTAQVLAKSSQSITGFTSTTLTGGLGTNAIVQILNEGAAGTGSFGQASQLLSLGTLMLQGRGPGSFARIGAVNGDQLLFFSNLTMTGGAAGASTSIDARNGNQTLFGNDITLNAAGDATTSVANAGAIIEGRNQTKSLFNPVGVITLNGGSGTAGAASDALLRNLAGSQTINADRIVLLGGFHDSTTGIVNLGTGTQSVTADNINGISLTGRATGPGADVRIHNTAATSQIVNASRFDGPLTLTNNGIGILDIRSEGSQSITGNGGISVTANTGADASITARTSQTFNSNNAGILVSSTASGNALLNAETGSQTLTAGNGTIAVNTTSSGNSSITAETSQTVNATNGGVSLSATSSGNSRIAAKTAQSFALNNSSVRLNTTGSGNASITTDTTQRILSTAAGLLFVDVLTSGGSSGNSTISSGGNQWIHSTNGTTAPTGGGSIGVRALGSGVASIDSGGRQLLEVDYPEVMQTTAALAAPGSLVVGATAAVGTSRVRGVDQSIFARSITVQGGSAANATSKLTGTNTQFISVVDGAINVGGGMGTGASASIDPETQRIVANNSGDGNALAITAAGANASVVATGSQTIIATRGDIALSGDAASALIQSTNGPQEITAAQAINLAAGGSAAGVAQIATAGDQTIRFGSLSLAANVANAIVSNTAGVQTLTGGNVALTGGGSANATALITTLGTQTFTVGAMTLTGGPGAGAFAQIHADGAQNLTFGSLTMSAGDASGAFAKIDTPSTQTLTGGTGDVMLTASPNANVLIEGHSQTLACGAACDVTLQGGSGAGSTAQFVNLSGVQTLIAGSVTLNGSTGANARASITSPGAQTFNVGALTLAGGGGPDAFAQVHAEGAQNLTFGALTMHGGNGPGAFAKIDTPTTQALTGGTLSLMGGGGTGALAQIHADGTQNLTFSAITMNAGSGSGAFAKIDTPTTQTLTGGSGHISLTASSNAGATLEGHSQTLTCGTACNIMLLGNAGAAGNAQIVNLSGAQTINAGSISLTGGQSASTTGILNQGTGNQTITASAGGIFLGSNANANGASALIQNVPASVQTITAAHDLRLESQGGGTVAVTSGGTQILDARALDVLTLASGPGGANATVFAPGDQAIRTRGALGIAPGVGMRVASLGTGVAKVETSGNQVLTIDGNQLLIGRFQFGPPGPGNSASGNPAAGDSLVLATSTTSDPNQTVTAGSIYIQGPSGNLRISKLSGDGTQIVTTTSGGISIIGGSGTDAFAIIDPTNQAITSFGDILLLGGTGTNADALINATGPQTVTSQFGGVTLIGGSGQGADALISTTSPFQSVSGPLGSSFTQGTNGGIAAFQQGSNLLGAQIAANNATNSIVSEQDRVDEVSETDAVAGEGDSSSRRGAQLCN